MKASRFLLVVLMLVSSVILSCRRASPPKPQSTPSKNRMMLTNDSIALGMRVKYFPGAEIRLDTTVAGMSQGKGGLRFKLKLRAEVAPPIVNGTMIQVAHVSIAGSTAFVSYNLRGEAYLGGVEVIDISTTANPRLVSQIIIDGTDVSGAAYDEGNLYLAEATSDTGFAFPAVIEEINLQNTLLTLSSRRVGIASYVATDVKAAGGKVFATSGSGGPSVGGLTVLDRTTFQVLVFDRFLDARSLDMYRSHIVVTQGTPAQLRMYDSSAVLTSTYVIRDAGFPESKSTVVVVHGRAFVAAGDGGVKVVSLETGAIIDSLPRAAVAGVDPDLTVTNAVSVNKDLLFIANGRAGVYVAQAKLDLEATSVGSPALSIVARIQPGAGEFANSVASANNILFVASGSGGLKIVEIESLAGRRESR